LEIKRFQPLQLFIACILAIIPISCSTYAGKDDMKAQIKRSKQFEDGKFQNKKKFEYDFNLFDAAKIIKKIYLEKREDAEPENAIPINSIPEDSFHTSNENDIRFSRLGHSTILLQIGGKVWLIDPVFSKRASPFKWFGAKRFHPVPIELEHLPVIEGVIISHDHYDHLDKSSIILLKDKVKHFLVPLGVDSRIIEWGVSADRISSFDWWESMTIGGVEFISAPAQHFSGRSPFDGGKTLWCSWIIRTKQHSIYYSGDSGYFDGFKQIGEKFGPFLITFLECGQYNEDWIDFHMLPEQSILAYKDLWSQLLVPVHNGTFNLSIHTWYDPLDRIYTLGLKENIPVLIPLMGQIIDGISPPETLVWWQNLK
jgi:L-ascorbate metabolism protein UlaG (beta-lactamase superfamily)